MNHENAIKTAMDFFRIIFLCALFSALAGGVFATVVGVISTSLVMKIIGINSESLLLENAFGLGMIWGFFIGVSVAGFTCILGVVMEILRFFVESKKNE